MEEFAIISNRRLLTKEGLIVAHVDLNSWPVMIVNPVLSN